MSLESSDVHVVFGEVARAQLRLTLPSTVTILVQRDILSFGKLEEIANLRMWKYLRNEQLNILYDSSGVAYLDGHDELINNIQLLSEAKTLTLWCGVGLEDQLLKAYVVRLLRCVKNDFSLLFVHQLTTMQNADQLATTVGFVNSEELLSYDTPTPITDKQAAIYLSFWQAYVTDAPSVLTNYLDPSSPIDNIFHQAMLRLLKRYPAIDTGLNYWQYRLLKIAQTTKRVSNLLAVALDQNLDPYDFVTEAYLMFELRRLSMESGGHNLLSVINSQEITRKSIVQITPMAEEVLKGLASASFPAGTNYWIGGVPLSSKFCNWMANHSYTSLVPAANINNSN